MLTPSLGGASPPKPVNEVWAEIDAARAAEAAAAAAAAAAQAEAAAAAQAEAEAAAAAAAAEPPAPEVERSSALGSSGGDVVVDIARAPAAGKQPPSPPAPHAAPAAAQHQLP
jgi:hypothetical protein